MALAKKIRILTLRDLRLARVSYKGTYQGVGEAYKKLLQWCRSLRLVKTNKNKTITIYHDDPNVVGPDNVRQSACIILDAPVDPSGEITMLEFKPGKCVVGRFEISFFQFKYAWAEVFEWIKENNLELNGDFFEVYQNNSNNHPTKKCIVDICIPVK